MQFGSDNHTGASTQVMEMLIRANDGFTHGYGDDQWTNRAVEALKDIFECDLDAFFVPTGTAANTLALSCLVQPWDTILCHDQAHILIDESTAPEFFTGGARLIGISQGQGKLNVEHLQHYFSVAGNDVPHNSSARALSITQASENGLLYRPEEVAALTDVAHDYGLRVHMDGARFSNAVAGLGCTPAEITWQAGVDVLCLGATKNGALAAEAVIFFKRELAENFSQRRKRAGHLLSKGRFLGAQFVGWLEQGHWLELAKHANKQAQALSKALCSVPGVRLVQPTEANEVFVTMPKAMAAQLTLAGAEFYEWNLNALSPDTSINSNDTFIRLVTSYSTQDKHISDLYVEAKSYANSC